MGKTFVWLATGGGAWSLASNWDDITDGQDPSLIVPGPMDTVSVAGPTGSAIGTVTGPGQAALAQFSNNIALAGSFAFGSLALGAGGAGGLLAIGDATPVSAGAATIASGSLFASGAGAALTVAGTCTLGTGQNGAGAATAALEATNGGVVTAQSLVLNASSASLYVDPSSVIDIGGTGSATLGALTIEAGATLSGFGQADAFGSVVNDGTILASGGVLTLGACSGTGMLEIGAGAVLDMNGRVGAGEAVSFLASGGTLALAQEAFAPLGTIAGFTTGDAIDLLGSPISAAAYAPTGQNTGILTLLYGSQVAATLTLLGNYSGDVFLVSGDGAGGSLVAVAPNGQGGGGISQGTNTPDLYQWLGGSGAWNNRLNWQDITSGADPSKIAPGIHDIVQVASSATSFDVIGGQAQAASLAITGELALSGGFAVGTLALGTGSPQVAGQLDVLPGTTLTASSAGIADGAISVIGSGSVFSVSGTAVLGGGAVGVGLPVTSISAVAGGRVQLASLSIGGGAGDSLVTDPTGSIEIGTLGGAIAGAVTIDAGAMLAGNGTVNAFGSVIDNGAILATGGTLTLGATSGAGTLLIDGSGVLQLAAASSVAIGFTAADGGTLALASELVAPGGVISGFQLGQTIDIEADPITGWSYAKGQGSGPGTLSLYYGGQVVFRLLLADSYANERFVLAPDGGTGTDITVAQGSGGGGGGGGQGNTDLLSWTAPGSGAWNRASNWTDLTTGAAATAPPGAQNAVLITGPMDGSYQVIGGPGVCASLTFLGDTALASSFNAGSLAVGNATTAGNLALLSGAVLSSTQATIANGLVTLDGAGVRWTETGVLTLGGGAPGQGQASVLLAAGAGAAVQATGLVMGGGLGVTVQTDSTASIEIGTLGGAVAGAITVDPGASVIGNGTLNPLGLVIDQGSVTAQGGTLTLGNVSGSGTLAIGAEATLALGGTATPAIAFVGGGATLLLESNAAPAAPVAGFAQGDAIVLATGLLTGVSYAPGSGGIGTLSLYAGTQLVESLFLAGNYAGDTFSVLPDGAGSEVVVQAGSGASGGTSTPDVYQWTGADHNGLWNDNLNWDDVTTGQNPAGVAPGLNNLVTVQGPGVGYLTLIGPADAASLSLVGGVALSGTYAVGTLSVAGSLAIGAGTDLVAASGTVMGGLIAGYGSAQVTGTLALGTGAVLQASNGATIEAAALLLDAGAVVATDTTGAIEVGTAGGAVAGAVAIDAGAELQGAGAVELTGRIVDQGTITAAGGTLALGAVSGGGTLEVGVDATLALTAATGGVIVDFAGPGTLTVAPAAALASAIVDFAAGDAIVLPFGGITSAVYGATGAGIGTLTLYAGNTAVDALTLLGVEAGQTFTTTAQGNATVLTTQPGIGGTGGGMQGQSGNGTDTILGNGDFLALQPAYTVPWLSAAINGNSVYEYFSPDGSELGANPPAFQPPYANVCVVDNPVPNIQFGLPPGYVALIVQGTNPCIATDRGQGNGVIIGNAGVDELVAFAAGDTLIGGAGTGGALGPGDLFWLNSNSDVAIGHGARDTIVTAQGSDSVQTAAGGRSIVFVGTGQDTVMSQGQDTIVNEFGQGDATVTALANAQVWGPVDGMLNVIGGSGTDTVVGQAGDIRFYGGTGNNSQFWCENAGVAYFQGGAGTAIVIGGSGSLGVRGGGGAITVFGGTGYTNIYGAPGSSVFVVGEGSSYVQAASGNQVWLVGAANTTLVAAGGNVLLAGMNSGGNNTFYAGDGPSTIYAGHGADQLMAGAGASTMVGGAGADIFGFNANGAAHGNELITNFAVGRDLIGLYGYTGGAGAVLATEQVINGNTFFTLQDGTQVELLHVNGVGAGSFIT